VAMPSSTTMTVLPRVVGGRSLAPVSVFAANEFRSASRSMTVRTCSSLIRRLDTTWSFITTPPPMARAPIASSGPLRHAQLPHQEDVQLCAQGRGDLPTDRYAAAASPEERAARLYRDTTPIPRPARDRLRGGRGRCVAAGAENR